MTRRAIVIGATSGIGGAVATMLAGQGYEVTAAARDPERGVPPGTTPAAVDVRSRPGVLELLRDSSADVVVNSAGVGFYAPVDQDHSARWREILETNVLGLTNLASAVVELELEPAHFVQIGSLASHRLSATPGNALYSASKTAGAVMVEHFRDVLAERGKSTAVTLVSPGFVEDTGFEERYFAASPEERVPIYGAGGYLTSDDVAEVVRFVIERPPHVRIDEVLVRPAAQSR